MKLKSGINKKKDIIYAASAVVLTAALAFYLFWFIKGLANSANGAFSAEPNTQKIPSFDFSRYDKLMQKLGASTSTQAAPLTKPASST